MIWFVFAAMTAAALAMLLWPLVRSRGVASGVRAEGAHLNAHLGIYRAQLAEIDRDTTAGRIDAADARAARTEAARRLVTESEAASSTSTSPASRRIAAGSIVIASCVGCALLYTRIGSPAMPDAPLVDRRTPVDSMDLPTAIAQIEAHLAKEPGDLRGWNIVAPVYLRTGRVDAARDAFAEILRLGGENADARAGHAEALVYAAQGIVTAQARREFEAAVGTDPKQAKARYYLGLASEQDGDAAKARALWSALATDSPQDPAFTEALRGRIAALDGMATGAETASDASSDGASDMASAVASLPADAQQAAIRGMVERLATRLHDKADDIEGWLRLVRAWRVLNDPDRAREALADALKQFSREPAATARLDALARELGLKG